MSSLPLAPAVSEPSVAMRAAALTGLLCLGASACGSTHDHDHTDTDDAASDTDPADTDVAATGPVITSTVTDETIKFADFLAECTSKGGLIQTHATCAGNNSCKGMSFNKFSKELTEHTCKGMNSCGGVSCVVLPTDSGKTGEEVWSGTCADCHGADAFTLYTAPGADQAAAQTQFAALTQANLVTIAAFGYRGLNSDGSASANMPGFHERYSVAELERVAEYLRTLDVEPYEYAVVGVNEDLN
jgi:hypothetical protein